MKKLEECYMKETFEFYCEGGCRGYTMVPLDPDEDRNIIFVCPKCKHEHYRRMKNGTISSDRHAFQKDNETVHKIEPLMSAYSEKQRKGFMDKLMESLGRGN